MGKTWGIYVPLVVGVVFALVGVLGLAVGFLPETFSLVLTDLAKVCGLAVVCALVLRIPVRA